MKSATFNEILCALLLYLIFSIYQDNLLQYAYSIIYTSHVLGFWCFLVYKNKHNKIYD